MRARHSTRGGAILAATVAGLLWAESTGAQSARSWVDPPQQAETPPPEPTPPSTPPAAQPSPPAPAPQPRRVDTPSDREGRPPSGEPAPGPAQAAPASRPPSAPPARSERAAPPASPAPEGRPWPEEAAPAPRSSPPPARSAEPPRPPPEPQAPAIGERRPRGSDYAAAAQELATAYLAYWSAPNAITLDATPEFYAPQVLFHGRQMSARALFEEKRRFVRRWPVREYHPRPESMRASCDTAPPICTVRTVFDFAASSPQTGRRSQGTALLQLGVSFASGEPTIVFESSQVTSRASGARSGVFEDDEDD